MVFNTPHTQTDSTYIHFVVYTYLSFEYSDEKLCKFVLVVKK